MSRVGSRACIQGGPEGFAGAASPPPGLNATVRSTRRSDTGSLAGRAAGCSPRRERLLAQPPSAPRVRSTRPRAQRSGRAVAPAARGSQPGPRGPRVTLLSGLAAPGSQQRCLRLRATWPTRSFASPDRPVLPFETGNTEKPPEESLHAAEKEAT